MKAADIWNQLVLTLQQNPTLAAYIKYVYEGRRFDVGKVDFPCIMVDPVSNFEVERDMNQIKTVFLEVNIYAFSTQSTEDFKKSIVGDSDYKGILDIENDIRACLQSSYDLGGFVYDVRMDKTSFDTVDDKYPIRGMLIPVKILYSQNNGV